MTEALRLLDAPAIARLSGSSRQTATSMIKRLGGWKEPGAGWVIAVTTWNAYIRRKMREAAACPENENFQSSHAELTGTATSGQAAGSGGSELSTSETTAQQRAEERPSTLTGKSKHEQRVANLIARSAKDRRSAKRSSRSPNSNQ